MPAQSESCVCLRLCNMHIFFMALPHSWISVQSIHSWEGGCLIKTCAVLSAMEMEDGRVGVFCVCYCFTKDLIKWLKGKGGKTRFLTQKALTWIHSFLRAARLGSAAGSVQPLCIICGCFLVTPLPSVGVLLAGMGGRCTQLLSGGGSPPTVGGQEQHLGTQAKKRLW